MDFPSDFIGSRISEGQVVWFTEKCPIGVPEHMHVCFKHKDKVILLSTCSSKTDTSIRLAKIRNWDINTFPIFTPNDTNKFTKQTYINCNKVIELTDEKFGEYVKEGFIELRDGVIDELGLSLITNGIKLSTEVTDEIKEML